MPEKSRFAQKEEEILSFWEANKIFEKTLKKKSPKGDYVFYDGPPFATGLPHYGHIVASLMKDAIPRFRTMQGYRVERRWGWDCHGLPIENLAEKELNLKTKKEIEASGIDKFNAYCHGLVLRYANEWRGVIKRLGRWVDMERDYKTMEPSYMESIWWVFKSLFDKGLIYEDFRITPYCPRCGTPLSNFELNQPGAYREIEDQSVYVKFPVKGQDNTYFLVWTTTPWTLPANAALAINHNVIYCKIKNQKSKIKNNEFYILAKDRLEVIKDDYEIIKEIKGKDLVGLEYESLYKMKTDKPGYKVVAASFVSTEDGTGIVHIAPAFGEDDMNLGKAENLPTIVTVDLEGKIIEGLNISGEGKFVKTADEDIKADLRNRDLLFKEEKIVHSYPFCWRCESPLLYYPLQSWYVAVTKIKDKVIANNQKINWVPAHLKEGRFGKWLLEIRDWAISRNRFWGSPIPIWRCQKCGEIKVIGSIRELEKLSGQKINDLHKHIVDKIIFKCEKCGGEMKRTAEVLDCWFESGSMPYAQFHYPFENRDKFLANFPAEFIAEGVDQTRGWFYTLLVLSSALFDQPAAKNIIANGIVLAEDGQKMSKSKGNYPDPELIFDKYGVDALRYYLFTSPVMAAENLNFSEKAVDESLKKIVILLGNVLNFYLLYAPTEKTSVIKVKKSDNILDRWILERLNQLIGEETQALENYDLPRSCRPLGDFINDLSTWYLRRSRTRFKDETAKGEALGALRYTLYILSKLLSPFLPFMAEEVYQAVTGHNFQDGGKSVHLENWPKTEKTDQKIIDEMEQAKRIVEEGLSARAKAGIKIRQPLNFYSTDLAKKLSKEIIEIIKEELNIKELRFGKEKLDIKIDDKLKEEGIVRDLTRLINNLRKKAGLTINDKATIYFESDAESLKKIIAKNKKELLKNTLNHDFKEEKINEQSFCFVEAKVDEQAIKLGIEIK